MAKQGIGTGTIPNDGTGDSLLDGAIKINSNFSEIYNLLGDGSTLSVGVVTAITAGTNISITTSYGNVTISATGIGTDVLEGQSLVVTGVSTLGNTVIGGGTTELLVNGDARITGILTIGTASITFDGTNNNVNVGSGITLSGSTNSIKIGGDITLDGATSTINLGSGITLDGTTNTINIGAGITIDGATGMISAPEIDLNGQVITGVGVTEIIAGTGISVDQATGSVTISATGAPGPVTGDVTATTLTVSGVSTFSGDVRLGAGATALVYDTSENSLLFPDGYSAVFGDAADLKIFHDSDGSNSYIQDNGTGNLRVTTNGGAIELAKGITEPMATFFTDGAVELYHDNSKKFVTTGVGASIIGVCSATSFVGDGSKLTNITASGTGIALEDGGTSVGTAGTINFADNIDVVFDAGIATVTVNIPGISTTGTSDFKNLELTGNVNSTGIVTAQSFVGDGSGLTNITVAGIDTAGTSDFNNIDIVGNVNSTGIVTANLFVGDGSGLTGVVGSGSGVVIEDSGSIIGTAGTINFATNLNVTAPFAGIVTVSAVDTGDVSNWTRTTAGIHTFASVGIGTTNPIAEFNVEGNAEISGALIADYVISTPTPINKGSGSLTGISTFTIPTATVTTIYDIGVNKSDSRFVVSLQRNTAQATSRELQLLTIDYSGQISLSNTGVVATGASYFDINNKGNLAYVSCPTVDRIYIYNVDFAAATISNNTFVDTTTSSPRRLVVHPNNKFVYCVCNANNVDVYQASVSGSLTHIQTISTQSGADFIEIEPSGRFLYVSNNTSNSISCFSINYTTGQLTLVEHQAINDTKPTDIITDKSGSYLYVSASQSGSNSPYVNIYEIDQSTGLLEFRYATQISANAEPVLSVQVDRITGRYVYFGTRNTIHVREINPYNGRIVFVQDILHQDNSDLLMVDATSNYLFTSDSAAKSITTYAISNASFGTVLSHSVGIGTDFLGNRTAKLVVNGGDLETNNGDIINHTGDIVSQNGTLVSNASGGGLILTSPNGTKHRVTITDAGAINIAVVP